MGIRKNKGRWTQEEHEAFLRGVRLYERNWEAVAALVPTRTVLQIRTHSQKYFAKIERGEVFPDQPYPSQYDAAAGKAGAIAGAYVYGLTQGEQQQQQQQHQQQLQMQMQHQQQLLRPAGMYGVAMPSGTPKEQAFVSSQGHPAGGGSCRLPGLPVGSDQQRAAAAAAGNSGFAMIPPVISSSSAAYGGSGGGSSSGASFGPAVHGYARAGAAPVAFAPGAPVWIVDGGRAPPRSVPMATACSRPQQDAMRMPPTGSSAASSSLSPPPHSWVSVGYVASSAAGLAWGDPVPARRLGGSAPADNGGGGGQFQQGVAGHHNHNQQQQQHGFGVRSVMGAPPPVGMDGAHGWSGAQQQQQQRQQLQLQLQQQPHEHQQLQQQQLQQQQQQQQQMLMLMQHVAPERLEDLSPFEDWPDPPLLSDDHGGGNGGGDNDKEAEICADLGVL